MARKPTDVVQLKLRFPEALRRRLARLARENRRSMNSEIILRLDDSVAATELERRAAGQDSLGKAVVVMNIGGKPYRLVVDELPRPLDDKSLRREQFLIPVDIVEKKDSES
jgi:hypothetical protein